MSEIETFIQVFIALWLGSACISLQCILNCRPSFTCDLLCCISPWYDRSQLFSSVKSLDRLGHRGEWGRVEGAAGWGWRGAWGTIQQRSSSSLFFFFFAGGYNREQFWHGQGCALYGVVHPAFRSWLGIKYPDSTRAVRIPWSLSEYSYACFAFCLCSQVFAFPVHSASFSQSSSSLKRDECGEQRNVSLPFSERWFSQRHMLMTLMA